MRIPFDSLCLAAVVDECQRLVDGRVQRVVQWDAHTVGIAVYRRRAEWLLLSCDARYFRAHLLTRLPESPKEPPAFCMTLRKHLTSARVEFVRQRGLDRVVDIGFSGSEGDVQLVAELMGKHSNLVLVGAERRVLAAAKAVAPSKSKRPVLPGREYQPPPFEPRPSLLDANPQPGERAEGYLQRFEGASPFLRRLIDSGVSLRSVQDAIRGSAWSPHYAEGHGAYPVPSTTLFSNAVPRESISQAIEQGYARFMEEDAVEATRSSLRTQLTRVLDSRSRALGDIGEALDAAARARETQEKGELILAYQHQIAPRATVLETTGYNGEAVTISLDPEKSAVENANKYFTKAKKAKEGVDEVKSQESRLERDRAEVTAMLGRLAAATTLGEVAELRNEADARRWLHHQVVAKTKEERPYEGHAVRELISPGGWRVVYGENATSNDYVTTKVARPNDYWFHVRGVTSAHVVLQTQNQPDRVQKEDLLFAARTAVTKSASKHSSYVTVDYTLKKHVRKPKKSAPGFVTYSNEKTLHIEQ